MAYSIKLTDMRGEAVRYLSFETYSSAVNCLAALSAAAPGRYYPDDYFEAGTLSVGPKGEVINERAAVTDHILSYSYKCID
jgi:hypothetical protein